MVGWLRIMLLAVGLLLASACGGQDYPALKTELTRYDSGEYGLVGWSPRPPSEDGAILQIKPDSGIYRGAHSYFIQVDERAPEAAAKAAMRTHGFRTRRVLATHRIEQEVLAQLEPDENGRAHTVMLEGKLNGRDAKGVALVWYGSFGHDEGVPANSGVYVFMAPDKAFAALGGYAVPAVRFFGATVSGKQMVARDGRARPTVATKGLADMAEGWIAAYAVQRQVDMIAMQMMMGQTMAIQQQTLNGMMSYNMALSTCGGMNGCTVEMDGTGGWYADIP